MDDQQREPGAGDRSAISDRIRRAVADGRISAPDGDIRLGNVASAHSMAELALITRDLDQLEATLPAGSAAPVPQSTWTPVSQAEAARQAASGSAGRTVPFLILGLVVALVVAGAVALYLFSADDAQGERGEPNSQLSSPVSPGAETPAGSDDLPTPVAPGEPVDPEPEPGEAPEAEPFELSAAGVKSFFQVYRAAFGTTKVVRLVMYGDYAIVDVPVPGKNRHDGQIYRDGEFTPFGGIRANQPGTRTVDLRNVDVAALMKVVSNAKRTLKVEEISTNYAIVEYDQHFDDAPRISVHVSNQYSESGHLVATFAGKILRRYPYGG